MSELGPSPPASADPIARDVGRHNGRRRWMAGALVAQIFMVFIVVEIVTSVQPAALVMVGILLCLAFGACYVALIPIVFSGPMARRVEVLAGLFLLTLPLWFVMGSDLTALWIFIGVAAGALLPARAAIPVAIVLAGLMIGLDLLDGETAEWELAATLVAVTLWMVGFTSNIRLNAELRRTRDELARTAVAVERERIGRDLHDILGHSLTAIAVKAGLARRLIGRDSAAAATEITDVERLAREALSDVRATAAGYRDVSLAGELAVARSVLQAAGIRAVLPSAVDDVAPAGREVFGYVVRESVTNVIRHSGATRCDILLAPDRLEIRDDGRGPATRRAMPGAPASGLDGLDRRLREAGGTLLAGPMDGGGFHVVATVGAAAAGHDVDGRPDVAGSAPVGKSDAAGSGTEFGSGSEVGDRARAGERPATGGAAGDVRR